MKQTYFLSRWRTHRLLSAGAAALIALAAWQNAGARQYVSLLPNYESGVKNGTELMYWSWTQSPQDVHHISDLWAEPTSAMFDKAEFRNCIFQYVANDCVIPLTPAFTLGDADDAGRMELHLALDADGNSPWDVARVEIYGVNAFNPLYNPNPEFSVNGVRAVLPNDDTRDYYGVDFPEGTPNPTSLLFETPAGSRVSFWDMKIYLRGVPEVPEGYIYRSRRVYGENDTLRFPAVKIGTLDPAATDRLQCSILNSDGEIVAYSNEAPEGEFAIISADIEEGAYRVCYHMPDPNLAGVDRCVPDPEDGLLLEIEPTFSGLCINGAEAGDFAYIPTEVEGTDLSWDNARLTGLRDGVEVWWRVTTADDVTADAASDAIPAGFTRYDDATGIRLTGGDRLQLILSKNGVSTAIRTLPYASTGAPTAIAAIKSGCSEASYWLTDGTQADPARVAPGTLLIERREGQAPRKIIAR